MVYLVFVELQLCIQVFVAGPLEPQLCIHLAGDPTVYPELFGASTVHPDYFTRCLGVPTVCP